MAKPLIPPKNLRGVIINSCATCALLRKRVCQRPGGPQYTTAPELAYQRICDGHKS